MGAWIDDFNQTGYIRYQFNQSLIPELFYKEDVNENNIEISLIPFDEDEQEEKRNNKKDFDW